MADKFNLDYYKKQYRPSVFHRRGDNPCVQIFWVRYIRKLKKNGKLLEVGCGEGHFLKRISSYFTAWGVDINRDGIDIAKKVADKANLEVCDAINLPFGKDFFDVVVAFDVIEHLQNPELYFEEAFRVLNSDGILIIRTPNPFSFGAKIKGDRWHGHHDKTHISIRNPKEWRNSVLSSKFKIIEEGTDTLWDSPYFKAIPNIIQKVIFIGFHQFINFFYRGFFKWELGENYICIAKKG